MTFTRCWIGALLLAIVLFWFGARKPLANYYCNLGDSKRIKGDWDGAIAEYDCAIALDPKNAVFHNYRGNVKFLMRNWPDALADYRQAGDTSGEYSDYPHLYTWLIRARRGDTDAANKELTGYLVTRLQVGKKTKPDDWISKIAACLLGNITGDDLLAAATSPDAKKDSGQHCEAWFFTGMKKLLAGDKQAAVEHFHKCLATQRRDFFEYQMAQSELKALGE